MIPLGLVSATRWAMGKTSPALACPPAPDLRTADAGAGLLRRSASVLLLPLSPPTSLQPGEVLLELPVDPLLLEEFVLRPPGLVCDRGALPPVLVCEDVRGMTVLQHVHSDDTYARATNGQLATNLKATSPRSRSSVKTVTKSPVAGRLEGKLDGVHPVEDSDEAPPSRLAEEAGDHREHSGQPERSWE